MRNIKSADDLLTLTKTDSAEITADIDCHGKRIPCLCSVFLGTINGNNHTISNLIVEESVWGDEQKISLFKHISNACIKNIVFDNIAFVIEEDIYTPQIAAFCTDVSDSIIENITMNVRTSNEEDIPMIYESVGGEDSDLVYVCNSKKHNIYYIKEGSLYGRN